jgi:DNA-binding NtrC family response regulator
MNFNQYFHDFRDPKIKKIIEYIREKIAPTDYPVIVKGPSGSGKEYFANLIHNFSLRKDKPFIRVDCPNLIEQLAGSELLGHEKGAFTDAGESKTGKFELADNGTIYFDLIEFLPLSSQNILFSAIDRKKYFPLGGIKEKTFRARVIVSTQTDLNKKIKEKEFLPQLYYLLNIYVIDIPPLRERKMDIPILIKYFLHKISQDLNLPHKKITLEAVKWCMEYSWPGNIRQLKNAIEKIYLSSSSEKIFPSDFFFLLEEKEDILEEAGRRRMSLRELEKLYISIILQITGGNKSKASKILGISRKTLHEKIKKLKI